MVRPASRLSNAGSQEDLGGQNTLGDQAAGAMAPATAGVEALRTGRVRALRSCALRLKRVGLLLLWFLLLAAAVSGLLLQGSLAWMGSPGTGVAVALAWGGSDTLRVLPSMTGRRGTALAGNDWSPGANAAAQREHFMESQRAQGRNASSGENRG